MLDTYEHHQLKCMQYKERTQPWNRNKAFCCSHRVLPFRRRKKFIPQLKAPAFFVENECAHFLHALLQHIVGYIFMNMASFLFEKLIAFLRWIAKMKAVYALQEFVPLGSEHSSRHQKNTTRPEWASVRLISQQWTKALSSLWWTALCEGGFNLRVFRAS